MCGFQEIQFGTSGCLITNSTVPISVNQDPNPDVEDKVFDCQKQ